MALAVALLLGPARAEAPDPLEQRWLTLAAPLLDYAKRHALPVDVLVVKDAPEERTPLALGYADGRCKLVFTLRGNRLLRGMMADVPPELYTTVAEAMLAHELGHCWRYVSGTLHTLPPDTLVAGGDAELARLRREMSQTRREEAYADLVSLAWTQQHRPFHYARLYDWLERVRRHPHGLPGKPHDTRSWLRLAAQPTAFGDAAAAGNAFEQAHALWVQALQGAR